MKLEALHTIPAELRARPQWIVWRYEERDGKQTKVPCQVNGAYAKTNDPSTWTSFGMVSFATGFAGIGFVLTPDDPYVGIDLDTWDAEAAAIVLALDSYTERSVSGRGAHVFVRANLNDTTRRRHGPIEVYERERFFVVTGEHMQGTPITIEERQTQLDEVIAHHLPKPIERRATSVPVIPMSDADLLERAFAASNGNDIEQLYRGNWEGRYDSPSEADLALCGHLAFWTGGDPLRIDQIFRNSGLMRPKWDERRGEQTYGARTIEEALRGRTDFYDPATNAQKAIKGTTSSTSVASRALVAMLQPDEAVYQGLAGRIVKAIDPHTEADPVAVLISLLTGFGSAVGSAPHAKVGRARHGTNLQVTLVGDTSTSRKGTSWTDARWLIELADEGWKERVVNGLVSGEGVIHHVRDPVEETKKDENGHESTKTIDPGVTDKRLMCVETEFGRVLTAGARQGSTLTQVLRSAWDGDRLGNLTRHSAETATKAHISVLGHITSAELLRALSETDRSNGVANRVLWAHVSRSKLLPFGGQLPSEEVAVLSHELRLALADGRKISEMNWAKDARELWVEEYPKLTRSRRGLAGAILSRGEAQVLRLSLIYALLDRSDLIRVEHLRAALALWEYTVRSVLRIFGAMLGDPEADAILGQLQRQPEGLTRTEIRDLFQRHASASRIQQALGLLATEGLAYSAKEDTGGRPTERWRLKEGSDQSAKSDKSQLSSHFALLSPLSEDGKASTE